MKKLNCVSFSMCSFIAATTVLSMPILSSASMRTAEAPVRPGGVNGQEFWNAHSEWFLYPPAFDFATLPNAVNYRFTVLDDQHRAFVFTNSSPQASLAPVWDELQPGFASVVCEGLDSSGASVGVSGRRLRFWRQTPFREGAYPSAKRGYAEAAALVYDYIRTRPSTLYLARTGEMDFTYSRNAYPAKMGSAVVRALVRLAGRTKDAALREECLRVARVQAAWLLKHSQGPNAPLANFPPTYAGTALTAEKYAGECMLIYPTQAAEAYLDLWEATQETRWLEAAKAIGETYLKLQGADGAWPLKMREKDGQVIGHNRCFPMHQIVFFERLFKLTGENRWRDASGRAFAFVETGPLKTWNWEGQFEDVAPTEKFVNLTLHDACATAIYLLQRFPDDARRLAQARELLRFTEDQFVCWERPCRKDGVGPRDPGGRAEGEKDVQDDYLDWIPPGACEQYRCYHLIDSSAAKMIRTYLALYRAERRPEDLAKARALGDAIVNRQDADGRIPTHWNIKHLGNRDYDWVNCMLASAKALEELANVK